jgi:ABC-type bacteriocin/lantibiotic exporter with double-glycine peptidase domain
MNVKDVFAQNNLAIQQTFYTCGPVALLDVLKLKGNFSHTEKELAKLCKTNPKTGTSATDLVKAAQQLGLEIAETKSYGTIKAIERHIDKGHYAIVCYQHLYSEDGHFGVITQYDDKAFYFRDPSYGLFRLRKKYFYKYWYGTEGLKRWFIAIK